jgi:hypothetical protein
MSFPCFRPSISALQHGMPCFIMSVVFSAKQHVIQWMSTSLRFRAAARDTVAEHSFFSGHLGHDSSPESPNLDPLTCSISSTLNMPMLVLHTNEAYTDKSSSGTWSCVHW